MFPNVRLLIAALLASVVALSCGFGVFAALRVNHDPLGRPLAGATALQLGANVAAAPPATWGVPIDPGLRLSEAQIGTVATDASITAPARRATGAPPNATNPWAAGTIKAEATDASPVPSVSAAQPIPISTAPALPSSAAPATAEPPTPLASLTARAIPSVPTAVTSTPTAPPASTARATAQEMPPVEAQNPQPAPDVVTKVAEETPAAAPTVAAIAPAANPAPVAQPADVTGTVPEVAAPAAKPPEKLTRRPERSAPRKVVRRPIERRVAKKRPVRRTNAPAVTRSGNRTSAFQEPVFQSAPDAFERPPATGTRGARKTAKNTTRTNPFAWPQAQ